MDGEKHKSILIKKTNYSFKHTYCNIAAEVSAILHHTLFLFYLATPWSIQKGRFNVTARPLTKIGVSFKNVIFL